MLYWTLLFYCCVSSKQMWVFLFYKKEQYANSFCICYFVKSSENLFLEFKFEFFFAVCLNCYAIKEFLEILLEKLVFCLLT